MTCCAMHGCHNASHDKNKEKKITFHKIPADPIAAARWIDKIRLNRREKCWKPTKYTMICSEHFDAKEMYTTKGGYCKLRHDAVPTKGLYISGKYKILNTNNDLHDCRDLVGIQLDTSYNNDVIEIKQEIKQEINYNEAQADEETDTSSNKDVIEIKQEIKQEINYNEAQAAEETDTSSNNDVVEIKQEIKQEINYNEAQAAEETGTSSNNDVIVIKQEINYNEAQAAEETIPQEYDSELDSIYDTPRESSLRKKLARKVKLQRKLSKKVKVLQQKVRRLTKKNMTLQKMLKDLKK